MSLERGVLGYEKKKDKDDKRRRNRNNGTGYTDSYDKIQFTDVTIIPIEFLSRRYVDIGFEMEVKSSFSESEKTSTETEKKGEASIDTKLGWGPLSVYYRKDGQLFI